MFEEQSERAASVLESGEWVLVEGDIQGRDWKTWEARQEGSVLRAQNILPLQGLIDEMRSIFDDHAEDIFRAGFEAVTERLDADTTFNPNDLEMKTALANLNRQAVGIAEHTQRRINRTVEDGVAQNKGVDEISDDVERVLRSMSKEEREAAPPGSVHGRGRRIASTTTTTAFERGQKRSMDKAGVFGRMWLSQRDGHVRRGHLEADGQTARLQEPFDVRGKLNRPKEKLMYPGDPSGRGSNVIQCRCTALPVPDRDVFEEMQEEEPDLSSLPQLAG